MNECYKKYQDKLAEAMKAEEIASVEYKVASNILNDYDRELQNFIEALKEKGICLKKEKMEKLVDDIESQLENV